MDGHSFVIVYPGAEAFPYFHPLIRIDGHLGAVLTENTAAVTESCINQVIGSPHGFPAIGKFPTIFNFLCCRSQILPGLDIRRVDTGIIESFHVVI